MSAPKDRLMCSNGVTQKKGSQPHVTRYTEFESLPQFLSVEEFRAFVGIGRSTIYDLLRRQVIPHVRFGRVVRIPKEALWPYLRLGEQRKENGDDHAALGNTGGHANR